MLSDELPQHAVHWPKALSQLAKCCQPLGVELLKFCQLRLHTAVRHRYQHQPKNQKNRIYICC